MAQCVDTNTDVINERTLAFLINDALDISISDLCRYIEQNYQSVDCCVIRKNYTHLSMNGCDIKDILTNYVYEKIKSLDDYKDDDYDYLKIIDENLDIFFDVTDREDDVVVVELAKFN